MQSPRVFLKGLVALIAIAAQASALAGFDGKTLDAYYALPNLESAYGPSSASPSTFAVGSGIETVFDVEGLTTISADFSNSQLTLVLNTSLTYPDHDPAWVWRAFNGLVFNVIAGGPLSFSGLSIDPSTTMAGLTAGRVGLTDGQLTINWRGLSYVDGTQVVINFATAVPEPETYAMFLAGLGAIGFVAWRRRPQG